MTARQLRLRSDDGAAWVGVIYVTFWVVLIGGLFLGWWTK